MLNLVSKFSIATRTLLAAELGDNKVIEIPINDVVYNDIILLGEGDKVPADGIIVSGTIAVDESMLNGEAKEKYTSFYYRYERWLLPIMVLFPALMIVTFAPYIFKMFGWYH